MSGPTPCWSTKQICIKMHVPSLSCPSTDDVLTTTPSGRPRNNAAELKALWLTGLPTNFSVFRGADWKACRPF